VLSPPVAERGDSNVLPVEFLQFFSSSSTYGINIVSTACSSVIVPFFHHSRPCISNIESLKISLAENTRLIFYIDPDRLTRHQPGSIQHDSYPKFDRRALLRQ